MNNDKFKLGDKVVLVPDADEIGGMSYWHDSFDKYMDQAFTVTSVQRMWRQPTYQIGILNPASKSIQWWFLERQLRRAGPGVKVEVPSDGVRRKFKVVYE